MIEVLEYVKDLRLKTLTIHQEAKDDVKIPDNEYFESDAYYEGAIDILSEILDKFGVHHD
jgi:hypothetical protein